MMDKIQILKAIEKDDDLKLEIVKVLMADEKTRLSIAREIFSITMQSMGLSVPGTIGDFIHKMVRTNACSKKNSK
jgi:hypothetical protein